MSRPGPRQRLESACLHAHRPARSHISLTGQLLVLLLGVLTRAVFRRHASGILCAVMLLGGSLLFSFKCIVLFRLMPLAILYGLLSARTRGCRILVQWSDDVTREPARLTPTLYSLFFSKAATTCKQCNWCAKRRAHTKLPEKILRILVVDHSDECALGQRQLIVLLFGV